MAEALQLAKYKSVEELTLAIDNYFDNCPDKRTVVFEGRLIDIPCPTITGLALFLGFASRQSFYDYEENKLFSYAIKKARLKIENVYEKNLHSTMPAGSIFALKNMGWQDTPAPESSTSFYNNNITVNVISPRAANLTKAIIEGARQLPGNTANDNFTVSVDTETKLLDSGT